MNSLWQDTTKKVSFPALEGDIKTDVLIIGGGISGILCSYMLKQAGVEHILVEADKILSGITKNTTAKVTFQHGFIYDKLLHALGREKAGLYLDANRKALERYKELCRDIDCDFAECDSYVYAVNDRAKAERELAALESLGVGAEMVSELPLPLANAVAVRIEHQGQFHPLKFAYAVAEDLPIFENTKVSALKPHEAQTDRGRILAEKIIIATHFPILNKHGGYFLKMYQHRSYVIALKNAADVQGIYLDEAKNGLSFRNHHDLLLIGGGSHRTGKQGGNWQELREVARKYYPEAQEVYHWATQDCMTLDGVPYIGRYAKGTEDLYVATGFNKWGFTSAMAAAEILRDLILGKDNAYAAVFAPDRNMFKPQLALNMAEAAVSLLTPTAPRCPHMGCALKYNKAEHSWDCACHGSRFAEDGKLLDNPATDDKKKHRL